MLSRRQLLGWSSAALSAAASPATASQPSDWLGPTRHIDTGHPRIQDIALTVTQGHHSDTARARALFSFMRDQISFGFAPGFWDAKASTVAKSGIGFCNTQSTLFTALLRAAGIPARQVFMEIDTGILFGLIDPGTPYLDHSCTEVYLDGRWVMTDAYIADPGLFAGASARNRAEGRRFGYGVHTLGTTQWDGTRHAFSQFAHRDDPMIGRRVWGAYADVADFYARAPQSWNRLNPLLRASMGLLAATANRRIAQLRAAAG